MKVRCKPVSMASWLGALVGLTVYNAFFGERVFSLKSELIYVVVCAILAAIDWTLHYLSIEDGRVKGHNGLIALAGINVPVSDIEGVEYQPSEYYSLSITAKGKTHRFSQLQDAERIAEKIRSEAGLD